MKKRLWIIVLAALLLSVLALGVRGQAKMDQTSMSYAADAASEVYADAMSAVPAIPEPERQAKIIYTAELTMETTSFDEARQNLASLTEEYGGYYASSSVSAGDGFRAAGFTIRIPAESYWDFLDRAEGLCHVLRAEQYADDVSEAYYDTQGRLQTQQTKLARLQELLDEAVSMEDIITIESALSETEEMIDALSGTLRRYDGQVDYATVTVHLREVGRLSGGAEPVQGFGGRLAAAFRSGWNGFLSAMEEAALALAYGWMWLIVAAAALTAVLLLWRGIRRRKKKRTSEK